jgi:hypothetical protein
MTLYTKLKREVYSNYRLLHNLLIAACDKYLLTLLHHNVSVFEKYISPFSILWNFYNINL